MCVSMFFYDPSKLMALFLIYCAPLYVPGRFPTLRRVLLNNRFTDFVRVRCVSFVLADNFSFVPVVHASFLEAFINVCRGKW